MAPSNHLALKFLCSAAMAAIAGLFYVSAAGKARSQVAVPLSFVPEQSSPILQRPAHSLFAPGSESRPVRTSFTDNESPEKPTDRDLATTSVAYIEAVGQKQFECVSRFLDPNVEFTTPGGKDIHGAEDYLSALKKLAPILVRNDVKRTFVDGNEVCIIYDFVTDTAVGAVPSVEWLTFNDRKIVSARLIFHSLPWPKVLEELARRAPGSTSVQPKQPK